MEVEPQVCEGLVDVRPVLGHGVVWSHCLVGGKWFVKDLLKFDPTSGFKMPEFLTVSEGR